MSHSLLFGRARRRHGLLALLLAITAVSVPAAQAVLEGPPGSGRFGAQVAVLPNGNFVVTDPGYDAPGPILNAGAAFLYRPDGTLISTLRGTRAHDGVGGGGVVVLANGNYVVLSPSWNHGTVRSAGAVTFVPGTTGIEGEVSMANSLVGSSTDDQIGSSGVHPLANGNYLVLSRFWDHGTVLNAGAVTFASGIAATSGVVSAANSLVGSHDWDQVGAADFPSPAIVELQSGNHLVISYTWRNRDGAIAWGSGSQGVTGPISEQNALVGNAMTGRLNFDNLTVLGNGNYVVRSPHWSTPSAFQAGAVMFVSGTSGAVGLISASNALVGSRSGDRVGARITALANGNYVVASPEWDHGGISDVGAVTFASGTQGLIGTVSATNSLIGSQLNDQVGIGGVSALDNGNYVVASSTWANGAAFRAGAATLGSGVSGIVGVVSPSNSLVGSVSNDGVAERVVALRNGNYVVESPYWRNAGVVAGAVTFGSGTSGISGPVSAGNSLIGGSIFDNVGRVTALANGNYVVASPNWRNGDLLFAGAVTFASGVTGLTGVVSPANSLVGTSERDRVGQVTPLPNGNYLVSSRDWDREGLVDAGAVTFGSGTTGISGTISASNSLVGNHAGQYLGTDFEGSGITILGGSNYLIRSTRWQNGDQPYAGAVTFGSGATGVRGVISDANSIVGSRENDRIGYDEFPRVFPLGNGHFVVHSPRWSNSSLEAVGAITLGLADGRVLGPLTNEHSVLGVVPEVSRSKVFSYDAARNQLIVGQPYSNRVVLHRTGLATTGTLTPELSIINEPVIFTAIIAATPNGPVDGQVRVETSTGQSCIATTPTPISATETAFSCTLRFDTASTMSVIAEYTGSTRHAWSRSALTHTTRGPLIFVDGFEAP